MNKKAIFTSILGIVLFSIIFGYSLVYAGTGIFDNTTKVIYKLSDNLYLDSLELKNTKILFRSGNDLSKYTIKSKCNIFSNLTYRNGDYYMFDLKFFDNKCDNSSFILVNEKSEIVSSFNLNLVSEYNVLSKMLDLETTRLIQLKILLDSKISKYSLYSKYDKNIEENYYKFLKNNRILNESIYNKNIIQNILIKRDEKYIVPVIGHEMPITETKLPNSGRPYRDSYTDGIHHGWDIDGKIGENVVALDDGIIIRVVSNFKFSDLNNIKRGNNLSAYDKTKNLDVLRGNQVWLKTMKGDVIFYSHLNNVFTNIKIGEIVKKGQSLGTIGISGVPDKNYKDSHLHFEVSKNPYDPKKIGIYTFDDYMSWDWAFKGQSVKYIVANQENIFGKGDNVKLSSLERN